VKSRVWFAAISIVLLGACSAPTRAEQVCARIMECVSPEDAPGLQACIDYVDRCVEALPTPERVFWEEHMDGCFDHDACSAFDACWGQVSQC
jgi:hypothetical protein